MDQNKIDDKQDARISELDKELQILKLEVERMKTANKIYLGIAGTIATFALAISVNFAVGSFAVADEYAQLKKETATQGKVIDRHESEIKEARKDRSEIKIKRKV